MESSNTLKPNSVQPLSILSHLNSRKCPLFKILQFLGMVLNFFFFVFLLFVYVRYRHHDSSSVNTSHEFSKRKDMLLRNHGIVIKFRKLNIDEILLICTNFTNCPNIVLHKLSSPPPLTSDPRFSPESHITFSCHVSLVSLRSSLTFLCPL